MGQRGPTPTGHSPVTHAAAGSLGGRRRRGLSRSGRSIDAALSTGSDTSAGTIADRCCAARQSIVLSESRTCGTSPLQGGRASVAAPGELGRVSTWSCCQESLVCRIGRSEPWHPLAEAVRAPASRQNRAASQRNRPRPPGVAPDHHTFESLQKADQIIARKAS
jgi:hypothetical protein